MVSSQDSMHFKAFLNNVSRANKYLFKLCVFLVQSKSEFTIGYLWAWRIRVSGFFLLWYNPTTPFGSSTHLPKVGLLLTRIPKCTHTLTCCEKGSKFGGGMDEDRYILVFDTYFFRLQAQSNISAFSFKYI